MALHESGEDYLEAVLCSGRSAVVRSIDVRSSGFSSPLSAVRSPF